MNPYRRWRDFLRGASTAESVEDLYHQISEWIKGGQTSFDPDLLDRYDLPVLLELDPRLFPRGVSDLDIGELIEGMGRAYPPSAADMLAEVRDLIWELLGLVTNVKCPRDDTLRLVYGFIPGELGGLVLTCPQCGWVQKRDEALPSRPFSIRPASLKEISRVLPDGIISKAPRRA